MEVGSGATDPFARSREMLEELVGFLSGEQAARASAAELEDRLSSDGHELVRLLLQDHFDLRAMTEVRIDEEVKDHAGVPRGSVETGHTRPFATKHGEVTVTRFAYRRRGEANLYPADAELNLPEELYSHGLRELAAIESARGSFEEAREAIARATGVPVPKRQVEQLAYRAAIDFEAFYAARRSNDADTDDADADAEELLLCLSADGKGIVMRPEALRKATAAKADKSEHKLASRLSKGEKTGRKRMAEVGSVFDVAPVPRTVEDILSRRGDDAAARAAPKAANKWTTASVVEDARTVIAKLFDEAERRDPAHARTWVALVDGARHQIDVIEAEAKRRGVKVHIVCDLIHVLEYIWGAAWCFHHEGDRAAEAWVADKARAVLLGNASRVAAAIRCKATALGLSASARKNADQAADYLLAKAAYLDYPTALTKGWPIATGVIEGACRYLVADRMDVTGARWGLKGAESVLKLRAIRANGHWREYWQFHLPQERRRVHESRYAEGVIPMAA